MPSPLFPSELFIMVGINVFVALSLLTSLFDEPFPKVVPYVYQLAALAGFGQFWVNYVFFSSFVEARFWCSMFYLTVAVGNVIAANIYIAINKKSFAQTTAFLGAVTIPMIFISFLSVSSYVNGIVIPMLPLPIVPVESLYIVFIVCVILLGFSMVASMEPERLRKMFWMHRKRQLDSSLSDYVVTPIEVLQENGKKKRKEVKNE